MFTQGFAHGLAAGGQECVGNTPAHHQLIDLLRQGFQYGQLGGHLGATDDSHHRPRRVRQRFFQRIQFAFQQRAGAGNRRKPADPVGGGLGAVGRAKGIHDENITQRRVGPRQFLGIFLLTRIEAHVLQHGHLAPGHLHASAPVRHQFHRFPQQAGEMLRHRGQRKLRVERPLYRPSQVGHQYHPGPGLDGLLDSGQGGADTGITAHPPVLDRNIEILADQYPLAPEVEAAHQIYFQRHISWLPGLPIQ